MPYPTATSLPCRLRRSGFALAFVLIALSRVSAAAVEPAKVLFEENFAGKLGPGWQWIRERPEYWRIADGALIIDTLPGTLWGGQNTAQNTLLRPAPASLKEGFILEVHLDNTPKGQFENAGLLCYFDPQNFVCLNKESNNKSDGKGAIFVFSQQRNKPTFSADKQCKESGIWIRLILQGKKATGQYRTTEQEPWQLLGDCSIPDSPKEPLVGLKSWYGQDKPVRHATFRSFRILKVGE